MTNTKYAIVVLIPIFNDNIYQRFDGLIQDYDIQRIGDIRARC